MVLSEDEMVLSEDEMVLSEDRHWREAPRAILERCDPEGVTPPPTPDSTFRVHLKTTFYDPQNLFWSLWQLVRPPPMFPAIFVSHTKRQETFLADETIVGAL